MERKQEDKNDKKKSKVMKEFIETQEKYKQAKAQLPLKKGKEREDFTMQLLNKFKNKLQNAKEAEEESSTASSDKKETSQNNEDDDPQDESWLTHSLKCEDDAPVLAKDASTKSDDWFEIYDPRNPLNKRRRGEKSHKSKDDRSSRHHSRR